ncbi:hypothetical protein BGAL_0396g00100 [Botrytis galanthina]|uniref:Uncharacterized protein n=1 Tax=Botrytis galanthina TaxID=278940 RepID=A0A4S8QMR6_9HELO|nr:hypothetical protein BGAL_0396g00100 [Botrytis galanthina]
MLLMMKRNSTSGNQDLLIQFQTQESHSHKLYQPSQTHDFIAFTGGSEKSCLKLKAQTAENPTIRTSRTVPHVDDSDVLADSKATLIAA